MVRDKCAEVVNESVRRMVDECAGCPDLVVMPVPGQSLEATKRTAALNAAMHKIIQTVHLN